MYVPKSLQFCLTLCDPLDCNPPGSSVHGIFQARILERVAMPSCRGSFQSGDRSHVSWQGGSLLLAPPGKPSFYHKYYILNCLPFYFSIQRRLHCLQNAHRTPGKRSGKAPVALFCWLTCPVIGSYSRE